MSNIGNLNKTFRYKSVDVTLGHIRPLKGKKGLRNKCFLLKECSPFCSSLPKVVFWGCTEQHSCGSIFEYVVTHRIYNQWSPGPLYSANLLRILWFVCWDMVWVLRVNLTMHIAQISGLHSKLHYFFGYKKRFKMSSSLYVSLRVTWWHSVDRVLSFFFSRPNWDFTTPPPPPQARLPSPWGVHTRLQERGWGSLNSNEGTDTVEL